MDNLTDTQLPSTSTPATPSPLPTALPEQPVSPQPLPSSSVPTQPSPVMTPPPSTAMPLPSSEPITTSSFTPPPPQKFPILKFLLIFVGIVSFLSIAAFSALLVDAYDVVKIHPKVHDLGKKIIASVPMLPKTPEVVIEKMVEASKKTHSVAYYANVSAKGIEGVDSIIGNKDVNLVIDGKTDWKNESNVKTAVRINFSDELEIETTYIDETTFLKINKLPSNLGKMISATLGVPVGDLSALENLWIKLDKSTSPSSNETATTDSLNEKVYDTYFDENIRPKVKFTSSTFKEQPTYHFSLTLTGSEINDVANLYSKESKKSTADKYVSDVMESLQVDFDINKKTYLLSGGTVVLKYDLEKASSELKGTMPLAITSDEPVAVTTSLSLSDYNQEMNIAAPSSSLTTEEFMMKVMQLIQPQTYYGTFEDENVLGATSENTAQKLNIPEEFKSFILNKSKSK